MDRRAATRAVVDPLLSGVLERNPGLGVVVLPEPAPEQLRRLRTTSGGVHPKVAEEADFPDVG
jgi:hypothetical protein